DWYEVEYGEYTGYISKEYAELVGDSTNTSNETSDNTNTVDENKSADNNSNTSSNTTTESGTNNGEDNTSNTNDNQPADNSTSTTLTGRIKQNTTIKIVPLISSSNLENVKANDEVTVIEQINNWVYI